MNSSGQILRACMLACKIAVVGSLGGSGIVLAQPADLLTPLDSTVAGLAASRNQHFVGRAEYWSKRTAVVRANWAVLFDETAETIRLQLFPGTAVEAKVDRVKILHGGNEIIWEGSITDPSLDRESLIKLGVSEPDIDNFVSRVSRIRISGAKVVFDTRVRTKYQYFDPAVSEAEESQSIGDNFQPAFEISTSFFLVDPTSPQSPPRQYTIRPFDQEPDIHLVTEVDHSKMYTPEVSDHDRSNSEVEKEIEYRQHMQTLGEDPRTRSIRREKNQ